MSAPNEYDVVVVGAGAAGLACAATLALSDVRVALVAETADVAWNIRPTDVDGNTAFAQFPVWQVGWDGGWWYQLARKLDIPVHFSYIAPPSLLVRDSGEGPKELDMCASAAGLVDLISQLAPFPLDDEICASFHQVFEKVMAMHWTELMKLSTVPLEGWLAEEGINEAMSYLFYFLGANMLGTTVDLAREHLSVFGLFGALRSCVGGEGPFVAIKPDTRTGLFLPMVGAIERLGGEVRLGAKVAEVIVEDGVAVGVALVDGTELRAQAIALATGTSRIPKILGTLPEDVRLAVEYERELAHECVCLHTLLSEPIVPTKGFTLVADGGGDGLEMLWAMESMAPWTTEPGKQLIVAESLWRPDAFIDAGGEDAIRDYMTDLQDELFPGFKDAVESIKVGRHRHLWLLPMSHGPKLPRRTDEIANLWFVGDGSAPIVGISGIEAAVGAGVTGARDIVATAPSWER